MIISDLEYLEFAEDTAIIGGAEVGISVSGEASGQQTITTAVADTTAISLGNGGSVAVGTGFVFSFAYTPPSFANYQSFNWHC